MTLKRGSCHWSRYRAASTHSKSSKSPIQTQKLSTQPQKHQSAHPYVTRCKHPHGERTPEQQSSTHQKKPRRIPQANITSHAGNIKDKTIKDARHQTVQAYTERRDTKRSKRTQKKQHLANMNAETETRTGTQQTQHIDRNTPGNPRTLQGSIPQTPTRLMDSRTSIHL